MADMYIYSGRFQWNFKLEFKFKVKSNIKSFFNCHKLKLNIHIPNIPKAKTVSILTIENKIRNLLFLKYFKSFEKYNIFINVKGTNTNLKGL